MKKLVAAAAVVLALAGCQRHTNESAARDDAGGSTVTESHVHAATPVEDGGTPPGRAGMIAAMGTQVTDAGFAMGMPPTGQSAGDAGAMGMPPSGKAGLTGAETPDSGKPASYLVRDNKLRCIKAPCPSLDAMPVDSSAETQKITDLDFSSLRLSEEQESEARAAVNSKAGLRVKGVVSERPSPKGGTARVLKVTELLTK